MSKILLIEDNEMNPDMLSRRLERKGFDVVIAGDEQKALEAGCDGYGTRPVDFKRLLGKIDNFLGAS
jgi:DNA-binding response OmpR family regulator